ncbi:MAG: DnaA regulatory inactivator Hda [Pseudomonadota bacterium]
MVHQLPLGIGFRHQATLDNFLGTANREPVRALKRALEGQGEHFVFLWGTPGCGRSHLLAATCRAAESRGLASGYVPLGAPDVQPALLEGLEQGDVLCLDDIQQIAGSAAWETALFHLYNGCRDKGGLLVVSADAAAAKLPLQLADLKSRLSWGISFRIHALGDEDRLVLLGELARERGLELDEEAARYLLHRCPRDTASLVRLMERLDAAALAAQRRLTIPFIRTQIAESG